MNFRPVGPGLRAHPCAYLRLSFVTISLTLFSGGCSNVPVWEQGLVSKSNMTFEDSAVFDYGAGSHASVEPGTAGSGGAQASGCTACK